MYMLRAIVRIKLSRAENTVEATAKTETHRVVSEYLDLCASFTYSPYQHE